MVTRPGFACGPHPKRLARLDCGCTGTKGLTGENNASSEGEPDTERIFASVRISSSDAKGRIPGKHRQRSVFPDPGAPSNRTLCPHAAAISKARFAPDCPLTEAKSGIHDRFDDPESDACAILPDCEETPLSVPSALFRRHCAAERRSCVPNARIPGILTTFSTSSIGRRTSENPRSTSEAACATIPATLRTDPSSASSPSTAMPSKCFSVSPHSSATIPSAIPRSNPGPVFRISAGARLTVTRFVGNVRPEFRMAVRTRSRLSCTDASPSPTTENEGNPGDMSTSIRTACPESPRIKDE